MSTSETPERSWPDCGEVQCKQVHDFMDTLLETLGVDTDKNTLAIGKGIQIATSVNELKAELTAAKAEVERLNSLTEKQHDDMINRAVLGEGKENRYSSVPEMLIDDLRKSRDAWKKMALEFSDILERYEPNCVMLEACEKLLKEDGG